MSIELGLQLIHQLHAHERKTARGLGGPGSAAAWVERAEMSSLERSSLGRGAMIKASVSAPQTSPTLALAYIPKLKLRSSEMEENNMHFDFIIKHPDSTFEVDRLRFMRPEDAYTMVARLINGFLGVVRTGIKKKNEENNAHAHHHQQLQGSSRSGLRRLEGIPDEEVLPLVYQNHQLHDDGSIAVALGLRDHTRSDLTTELARFCDYLHSPECTQKRDTLRLSEWGIFGLLPVARTMFSFCWDAAFIYNMLQSGNTTLRSALSWIKDMGQKLGATDIEWLRIGGFLINYLLQGKEGFQMQEFLQEIIGNSSEEELQAKCNVLLEVVMDLCTIMTETFKFPSTTKWKTDLQDTRTRLQEVQDNMRRVLEHLDDNQVQRIDETVIPLMSGLYFAQREALNSISAAVLSNKKIWNKFRLTTGFCCATAIGSGILTLQEVNRFRSAANSARSASAIGTGIKLSVSTIAPPVLLGAGLALSVYCAWDSISNCWMNLSWCDKIDACLRICDRAVSKSHHLTGYLYLFQNFGREGIYIRDTSSNRKMDEFIRDVITVTGKDLREDPEAFVAEGYYKKYIEKQLGLLEKTLQDHKDALDKAAKC